MKQHKYFMNTTRKSCEQMLFHMMINYYPCLDPNPASGFSRLNTSTARFRLNFRFAFFLLRIKHNFVRCWAFLSRYFCVWFSRERDARERMQHVFLGYLATQLRADNAPRTTLIAWLWCTHCQRNQHVSLSSFRGKQ